MAGVSTEAKVGIFVMVGLAVLAYMTIRLGSFDLGKSKGYIVYAEFKDVSGLANKAPVEMAGIPIGVIDHIGLVNGKARVGLRINENVRLASDAVASIRTKGVLGDKYVAVEPGSPSAPALKDGDKLVKLKQSTDLEDVLNQVGTIAEDIKAITTSLRTSLASPQSQINITEALANIKEITASLKVVVADNQDKVNQMVDKLERFATNLDQITGQNKAALNETVENFRHFSASLDNTMASVSGKLEQTISGLNSVVQKIDQGEGAIGALVNDRKTIDDLNSTLASLKDIAKKIDEGKGTIGKLVNDDTTITQLDEALTGLNDYISQNDSWKIQMSYRGEYLSENQGFRNIFNVRIMPRADKFFLLGVVDDPVGRRTKKEWITTTTDPDGNISTETRQETQVDQNTLMFNAQIGKRFHNITGRAGLFQSSGGLGLDYYLLDDRLQLSLEAFDFSRDDNPHLKASVDYHFWKYFYVSVGWDDFISDEGFSSYFVGGGVRFFDDDLRTILTSAASAF